MSLWLDPREPELGNKFSWWLLGLALAGAALLFHGMRGLLGQ